LRVPASKCTRSVDGVFMWTIHCERDDFAGQVEVCLFRLNHNLRILGSAILALNVLYVWSRHSLYEYRRSIRTAETSNTSNGVEVDIYVYIQREYLNQVYRVCNSLPAGCGNIRFGIGRSATEARRNRRRRCALPASVIRSGRRVECHRFANLRRPFS
jgi:hypothetical protein